MSYRRIQTRRARAERPVPREHHKGLLVRRLLARCLLPGLLLVGCGQKGDLYQAEDDPARAERDARGRVKTFPFPDTSKPWPPAQSPLPQSTSTSDSTARDAE